MRRKDGKIRRMKKSESKHREIFDILRHEILTGKYDERGQFPSELSLARRFGVSRPTVTRALIGLKTSGLLAHDDMQARIAVPSASAERDVEPIPVKSDRSGAARRQCRQKPNKRECVFYASASS